MNIVELGNDGKATEVRGDFNAVVSSGSTFILSRIDRRSEMEKKNSFTIKKKSYYFYWCNREAIKSHRRL